MSNKLDFRNLTLPVSLPATPPKPSELELFVFVLWVGHAVFQVLSAVARDDLSAVTGRQWFPLFVAVALTLGFGLTRLASARGLPRLEISKGRVTRRTLIGRTTTIGLADHAQVFLDGPEFPSRKLVFLPMQPGGKRHRVKLMPFVTTPGDDDAILGLIRRAAGDRPLPTPEQMKALAGRRRIEPFAPLITSIGVIGLLALLAWAGLL